MAALPGYEEALFTNLGNKCAWLSLIVASRQIHAKVCQGKVAKDCANHLSASELTECAVLFSRFPPVDTYARNAEYAYSLIPNDKIEGGQEAMLKILASIKQAFPDKVEAPQKLNYGLLSGPLSIDGSGISALVSSCESLDDSKNSIFSYRYVE